MESASELTPKEQARLERHLKFAERQRRWPWVMKVIWGGFVLVALAYLARAASLAWAAYGAFVELNAATDQLAIIAITNVFWDNACRAMLCSMTGSFFVLVMLQVAQAMRDHRLIVKLHARARPAEPAAPDVSHAG